MTFVSASPAAVARRGSLSQRQKRVLYVEALNDLVVIQVFAKQDRCTNLVGRRHDHGVPKRQSVPLLNLRGKQHRLDPVDLDLPAAYVCNRPRAALIERGAGILAVTFT